MIIFIYLFTGNVSVGCTGMEVLLQSFLFQIAMAKQHFIVEYIKMNLNIFIELYIEYESYPRFHPSMLEG